MDPNRAAFFLIGFHYTCQLQIWARHKLGTWCVCNKRDVIARGRHGSLERTSKQGQSEGLGYYRSANPGKESTEWTWSALPLRWTIGQREVDEARERAQMGSSYRNPASEHASDLECAQKRWNALWNHWESVVSRTWRLSNCRRGGQELKGWWESVETRRQ